MTVSGVVCLSLLGVVLALTLVGLVYNLCRGTLDAGGDGDEKEDVLADIRESLAEIAERLDDLN